MPDRPHRRTRRRWAGPVVLAALALAASGGCGFVDDLAHPTPGPSETAAPSTASPAGQTDRPVAEADVVHFSGGSPGVVRVFVQPERQGVTALSAAGLDPTSCRLSDDSTSFVEFRVDFANHGGPFGKQDGEAVLGYEDLTARVEVRAASGRPAGVGVFIASVNATSRTCPAALPPSDTFATREVPGGEHAGVTGFVVVRAGGAPAPAWSDLTLAITQPRSRTSGTRDLSAPVSPTPWQVQRFASGSACPGHPASICAPLG